VREGVEKEEINAGWEGLRERLSDWRRFVAGLNGVGTG